MLPSTASPVRVVVSISERLVLGAVGLPVSAESVAGRSRVSIRITEMNFRIRSNELV